MTVAPCSILQMIFRNHISIFQRKLYYGTSSFVKLYFIVYGLIWFELVCKWINIFEQNQRNYFYTAHHFPFLRTEIRRKGEKKVENLIKTVSFSVYPSCWSCFCVDVKNIDVSNNFSSYSDFHESICVNEDSPYLLSLGG